jgi:hypothetical protein
VSSREGGGTHAPVPPSTLERHGRACASALAPLSSRCSCVPLCAVQGPAWYERPGPACVPLCAVLVLNCACRPAHAGPLMPARSFHAGPLMPARSFHAGPLMPARSCRRALDWACRRAHCPRAHVSSRAVWGGVRAGGDGGAGGGCGGAASRRTYTTASRTRGRRCCCTASTASCRRRAASTRSSRPSTTTAPRSRGRSPSPTDPAPARPRRCRPYVCDSLRKLRLKLLRLAVAGPCVHAHASLAHTRLLPDAHSAAPLLLVTASRVLVRVLETAIGYPITMSTAGPTRAEREPAGRPGPWTSKYIYIYGYIHSVSAPC